MGGYASGACMKFEFKPTGLPAIYVTNKSPLWWFKVNADSETCKDDLKLKEFGNKDFKISYDSTAQDKVIIPAYTTAFEFDTKHCYLK